MLPSLLLNDLMQNPWKDYPCGTQIGLTVIARTSVFFHMADCFYSLLILSSWPEWIEWWLPISRPRLPPPRPAYSCLTPPIRCLPFPPNNLLSLDRQCPCPPPPSVQLVTKVVVVVETLESCCCSPHYRVCNDENIWRRRGGAPFSCWCCLISPLLHRAPQKSLVICFRWVVSKELR